MNTQNRKAIVLVVDRLGPSQIGAYGNTCHATDAIDEIASESILFDLALSPCESLEATYCSLFDQPASGESRDANWLQSLTKNGIQTKFLADRDWLADRLADYRFDVVGELSVQPLDRLASSVSQTWLARYFAQALNAIESMPDQSLLWLDCSGLARQWDAPYALRQQLADPDDPDPPQFYDVPSFLFDSQNDDPDTLLGVQQALDAQVNMLDRFIGVLLDAVNPPEGASTLLCFTSLRGMPLGQHGIVGTADGRHSNDSLPLRLGYNESVHVPMIVNLPIEFADARAVRSGKMVSPQILPSVIESFLTGDDDRTRQWVQSNSALPASDRAMTVLNFKGETGIQTHAWKFLQSRSSDYCELYAKPDDLREVNNVGNRCPREVRLLRELMDKIAANPSIATDPHFRLPAELVNCHQ